MSATSVTRILMTGAPDSGYMQNRRDPGVALFVGYDDVESLRDGCETRVIGASSAEAARERLSNEEIGVVVSEYRLGDTTGVDLLEAVREEHPELPFVLWTADGDEVAASRAVSAGATEYLIGDPATDDRDIDDLFARLEAAGAPARDRDLEKATRRYETIVDRFPNGLITLFDEEHRYQLVGGRGFEKLPVSPEDLEGNTLEEVFPAENAEELRPLYEGALEGESSTIEVNLDGHHFRIHVLPIRDEAGDIFAGMTMSQDVTERKERQRALENARERYAALVDAAPDPIFVADAETGEIVETNAAAEAIREQPREEIIGSDQTALHPAGEIERYRELFENHVDAGGTMTHLPDGSPIYLTTGDGERIPVEISVATVDLRDQSLITGIFRDVSEQRWYETALEELNAAAGAFFEAETETDIARTAVEVGAEVLDVTGVVAYRYDERQGELNPVAQSPELEATVGGFSTLSPGNSIVGRVYADQEPAVVDNVRKEADVANPGTPIRSGLFVPLGEHGVLLAADTEVGVVDELTADLTEILAATAEASLDRIERTNELREQQRESRTHARQLERVNEINEKIRSIIRAVVGAETRGEIQQAVCEDLLALEEVGFVWIGERDHVTDELAPEAWAGTGREYLDSVALDLATENACPAVRAARSADTAAVATVADGLQGESWRRAALLHEHRSVLSVPIRHDEFTYGALSLYGTRPSAFDDLSSSVLTELGELVGYSLRALEQRNALLDTGLVEITYRLTESEDAFARLASRLEREIEIRNVSSRTDGSYVVHGLVHDDDPERFVDAAAEFLIFDGVRTVSESGPARFEVVVSGSCIVTAVADLAARMHSIRLAETGSEVTLSIPQDRDVRSFTDRFRAEYPDASLVARQDIERAGPTRLTSLLDQLTERQREVLEAAYFAGFFDQPRKSTGSEVAEALGISQPAFSKQLRHSERKLLEPLYEPD